MLSLVIAKMHANIAGYDAAVMLDDRGFVAELNDTNLFMVKKNKVYTPFPHACLPGITRGTFMEILKDNNIEIEERDLTIVEFINADLVFATGTNGEITPVTQMDGRDIKCNLDFLEKIKNLFETKLPSLCEPL